MLYWWCTMVVQHRALCAQWYVGGARWSCTIVRRVSNAILVGHNGRAPACTACTMLYWWCTMVVHHLAPGARCYIAVARTMVVHHRAPGAQCYIDGARWLCTMGHLVHDAILVVQDGRAPSCTGCTILPRWEKIRTRLNGCGQISKPSLVLEFSFNFKNALCHTVYTRHGLQGGFSVCYMQCESVT